MNVTQSATTIDTAAPASFTCAECPFARHIDGDRYCCTVSQTAADVTRGHWEATISCFEALAAAAAEPEAPITTPAPIQTQQTAWAKYLDQKAIEFLASKQIIKSAPIPGGGGQAPGFIVLRKFGAQLATHFYNAQDGGFHHGHYFLDLDKAEADFKNRVAHYSGPTE